MPYKLIKRNSQYCVIGPNVDSCYPDRADALAYLTTLRLNVSEAKSFTPPQAVRNNARRALQVRSEKPPSQRGMTAVGIARARDLSNGTAVSLETIKRMNSYFSRHEVDKKGSSWGEQGKGWQAWYGWGGDAGWRWARKILRQEGELND